MLENEDGMRATIKDILQGCQALLQNANKLDDEILTSIMASSIDHEKLTVDGVIRHSFRQRR